ncbi:hypothetical protein BIW11_13091 [Tropilaelaps mercedesae]|uniref:Uncharacterized protein n=1 Tax=Tropilaelaps mercedesae TaxID=418985 RepID=A0A1V9X3T3_9ACAR|nr:hypothetical protein BIW11_13091 [Tropilaelaps mercedesae]
MIFMDGLNGMKF